MEDFTKRIPSFKDFKPNEENKTKSMRNYKAYLKGEEPLKHCFITHKEGDPIYDYIKKENNKSFKQPGFEHFEKK